MREGLARTATLALAAALATGLTLGGPGPSSRPAGAQGEPRPPLTEAPHPEGSRVETTELSIPDVAALARPSVVDVLVDGEPAGSGVRVGPGVITSAHVVGDASAVQLTLADGARSEATVVRLDEGYDLALLHPAADLTHLPALSLEPAGSQRQGDTVLVLGYPALGEAPLSRGATLTRGIISAVRTDEETGTLLIQTDAPIGAGASGGALLNLRGRLVGIPTFSIGEAPGLGFAVAADTVQAFLEGQPSREPAGKALAAYLLQPADLGPNYEGSVEPPGRRERRAYAFADSPTGPAVVQVLLDAGSPERAAQEAASEAATAREEGATEVQMAGTAGKRVFVRYTAQDQEMGVLAVKGPYLVTLFLDFAGLPDTGGRTELAVRLADQLLARLPG
jgi:S1-C subfamily serine protease